MKHIKEIQIKAILNSKVQAVSTNSLDGTPRVLINGDWYVKDVNPSILFGSPQEHIVKLNKFNKEE